ncbi:ABC transporter ATP-binding protein [Alkalibacillus haloalkaliphilus]|uniref:ABC transporter ATP-binding protein n=1 Tax=Alkalibacillus haloalkaliphilus TaxID=94136 RepID=UPI000303F792|nr:ABC transporter ATP-binding protein [Alkalibacillus haloalkaliphilus]
MIKLKNITLSYKDHNVLDQLSFHASPGEIIGVAAPNGTGKTTMFNVMANFLKPDEGYVEIDDQHTFKTEKDEIKIHKQMATFPEQKDLFEELTGVDHLKLYGNMWKGHTKHVKSIIERLNMESYVKKKVKTYSLGMRQRLCFAMMAAADTPIMLMDEVMNGLDLSNVSLISKILMEMKQQDKVIFVASHLLENLDLYADRVIFLKDGKIVHEHHLHYNQDDYIKIQIHSSYYSDMKNRYTLPDEHEFIANNLLCIPINQLEQDEQTAWIKRALQYKTSEISIGPLGTIEYYEKYYHETIY